MRVGIDVPVLGSQTGGPILSLMERESKLQEGKRG
jgi:hypothetical protein